MYCLYAWFGSAAFGKRHIAHLQRRAQGFKAVYFSAPHSIDKFQMQGKDMQTKFSQFLRFGGSGAFIVRRKGDAWIGTKIRVSTKSEFPNYAALRENFGARLDGIIKANSATLLQAVTEKYDPPLTEKDLPSVEDSRDETLSLWEERIEVIWDEWHSHPQRLRPVREAMEQHLLRGFAALINELRQRALGIRQYTWRSRDDGKVRSTHAQYDDRVFNWDNPPDGGHPGQAFNCRCQAEPFIPQANNGSSKSWDGFAFRYGDADRDQMRRSAEAEMLALRPAIEALAKIPRKTADQVAEQRALAEAFMAAAYRYELASREAGALGRSGLLFGPEAERARLIAEAEAYRKGADVMARGMLASSFLEGIHPSDVLKELRQNAPETLGNYLNSLTLMASVPYLPNGLMGEEDRLVTLRDIGRGFVAAARAVERERGQRGAFDPMQWEALSADMQRIAGQRVSAGDARAVNGGMQIEAGRLFIPEALSILAGGLFGMVGAAVQKPLRITADILDDSGKFLGQRNAGNHSPLFVSWLTKPENSVEIMPGGQVRYTTIIRDIASPLHSRAVSVSYANGFPDFAPFMTHPSGVQSVTINMTGTNRIDFRLANIAAGHPEWGNRPPAGWTWHHNEDGSTMELVPSSINNMFHHMGGASLAREKP